METKYSAKQSQRLSGNHQRRNVLHRHQKFDTPEKIPDSEKIGTKPKRPRFGRNYELEDITRKDIFLSELPEDKLLAHLRVYIVQGPAVQLVEEHSDGHGEAGGRCKLYKGL